MAGDISRHPFLGKVLALKGVLCSISASDPPSTSLLTLTSIISGAMNGIKSRRTGQSGSEDQKKINDHPAIGNQGREPDFVLFGNHLGVLFLEVKDWLIDQIEEADWDWKTQLPLGAPDKAGGGCFLLPEPLRQHPTPVRLLWAVRVTPAVAAGREFGLNPRNRRNYDD
jgi:hypothetical protein